MIALLCVEEYKINKISGLKADFKKNGLYFAESEDEYGHYHFRNMGHYSLSVEGEYFEKLSWDEARLALLLFDDGPKKV